MGSRGLGLMNDGRLWGLGLVKTERIRIIGILVHRLILKIHMRSPTMFTIRLIKDQLITLTSLMRTTTAAGTEADNHNQIESHCYMNHTNPKKNDRQVRSSNFKVCGCKARVVFDMVVDTTKYILTTFDVEHNHELDRVEYKDLFKAERKLTYNEQLFIIKAANANIGAVRALFSNFVQEFMSVKKPDKDIVKNPTGVKLNGREKHNVVIPSGGDHGVEGMDMRCNEKITSEPEELFSIPLSYSTIVGHSEEEQLYILKESKHEGNPWMTEEELECYEGEKKDDDNKLTLECYEEEKKEDNHVSKMQIGISIDGGIIDFKNLKFKDWLDVRYGNDQPKDLLERARLFKEWVDKTLLDGSYMD
nr:hypothetical protein [Tanacetum cinerariifolium]